MRRWYDGDGRKQIKKAMSEASEAFGKAPAEVRCHARANRQPT